MSGTDAQVPADRRENEPVRGAPTHSYLLDRYLKQGRSADRIATQTG